MALSSSIHPILIEDASLENWKVIGSGGFGQVYKARHHKWCCDVAVKLLHYDDGRSSSLLREVEMMRQGSSPYVIQVLGVFKGRLPSSGPSAQLGLVMEFMERGTLASLQDNLCGVPPWPLAFRLAHQIGLGVNFLHSLTPALLHLDLKPSNVLLDFYLNTKLTDFGLARFSHSVTRVSKKDSEEEGGTISYMPPEAFDLSYSPTRASDIYSYGILLWSIVTGKQPYANALSSIVRLRIPQGDRPSLEEIRSQAAGRAGITGLMELMVKCWEAKPDKRPSSFECTTMTEELYKMHKHAINDAVHQVLKKLDQKEEESLTEHVQRFHITQASDEPRCSSSPVVSVDSLGLIHANQLAIASDMSQRTGVNINNVPTGRPPIQEMAWTPNPTVKDVSSPQRANVCNVDHSGSPAYCEVKPSSVHPIESFPPSHSIRSSHQVKTANAFHSPLRHAHLQQYQRQLSSPDTFSSKAPVSGKVNIYFSNVTGLQSGINNTMTIYTTSPTERKRHPTAPSTVTLPPPHPGKRKQV